MSVIDGESVRVYNKTLNGLDTLGNTEVGDLTVTGDLLVEGGSIMEGGLDMKDTKIIEVADPTNNEDAANKQYVDTAVAGAGVGTFLPLVGGTMSGEIDMGSDKITNLTDGTAAQDAVSKSQMDTAVAGAGVGTFLPLAGGTMTGEIDMGSDKITNLTDGTAAQDAVSKSQMDTAIAAVSSFWEEKTAGSAYDTLTVKGTQADKAVSIGYNSAALPTSNLVRLYVYDASNAVVTRNQSATITTDVIATTSYSQILADNVTGAGTSAPLFLTGRGNVILQHVLPADGSSTNITSTTASSFNTQVGMTIGAGFIAEPESSIVAGGTINNSNPSQKGVHLGDIGDYGTVQLCGSNGGTVEFTDQTEVGTTTFNSRIFYNNTLGATNDLITWVNRPKNASTSYEWLAGCGNVVQNVFQGLNFYNPSSSPTREYSIGRELGAWSAPFPSLYQSWGTGIKFVTNAAIGAQATFKWYFDNAGTTPVVEISNGGKIASSYNPMIYASGVTTSAGTGFLRSRNTTSISLTATGQYTITLSITMPSTNYGVTISPEFSASNGYVFNKTTTTFEVVTYVSASGVLGTLSFSFVVTDFE
jgi:hypothetical protein